MCCSLWWPLGWFRGLLRLLSSPGRSLLLIILFSILLRSLFHASVLLLSFLSTRGVQVPILEYIDTALGVLITMSSTHYTNPTALQSLWVLVTSLLVSFLSLIKNLLLLLSNGRAVIGGDIPYDKYSMAEQSWNYVIVQAITSAYTTTMILIDTLIAKTIGIVTQQLGYELTTLLASLIHTILGLLAVILLIRLHQHHPQQQLQQQQQQRKGRRRLYLATAEDDDEDGNMADQDDEDDQQQQQQQPVYHLVPGTRRRANSLVVNQLLPSLS